MKKKQTQNLSRVPFIYPWQQIIWQQFTDIIIKQKIPHALLFQGAKGMGKSAFALALAQALLCAKFSEKHQACQTCHSCQLFMNNHHPDCYWIEPEEKTIKIEQIRMLVQELQQTSHTAQYKVAIINPAHMMTRAASNALLKTLEEPPAEHCVIMLITDLPMLLPPTIISRCQKINFVNPDKQTLFAWLNAQDIELEKPHLEFIVKNYEYAPLQLLEAITNNEHADLMKLHADLDALIGEKESPIALANRWQKQSLIKLLDWLIYWLGQQIKIYLYQPIIQHELFDVMDFIYETKNISLNHITLNQLLLIETIFIKIRQAMIK